MKTSHSAGYFKQLILLLLLSLMTIFVFSADALALTGNDINSCADCHGYPPIDSAYRNITTGSFVGNHNKHASVGKCDICHGASPTAFDHRDGKINFRLSINDSPHPVKNTYVKAGAALFVNQTSAPNTTNASCSTANCHFETLAATWGSPTANTNCNSCHGSLTSNEHSKHTATYNYACVTCHPNYTTFDHATSAGNIGRGIAVNSSNNYTGSNYKYLPSQAAERTPGNCSNLYCHSNGKSLPDLITQTVTWRGPLPADCSGCHGTSTSATLSGAHNAHMNNANEGGGFKCADCHAPTITSSDNLTIANYTKHVNKLVNYSGVYAGKTNNCSAFYCHSNGKGVAAVVPAWNSGTDLKCSGCHGSSSTDLVSGSHAKHLAKNSACYNCHWNTTQGAGSIANVAQHINRTAGVNPGGTFGLPATSVNFTGTVNCSTVTCHANGTSGTAAAAVWGGSLKCDGCHPNLQNAHKVHAGYLNLATGVKFYNYTANKSTGAETVGSLQYGFGCANCHPLDTASHVNGSVEVALAPIQNAGSLRQLNKNTNGTVTGSFNNFDKTCDVVYCHGDGRNPLVAGGNGHAPGWNTTFTAATDRCSKCHGNTPADATHTTHVAGGIHSDNIFSGSVGKLLPGSTGSVSHGVSGQVTTINCNICHNATITTSRNEGNTSCSTAGCHSTKTYASIAGLGKHINGKVDIFFAYTTIYSKAQLRDESFTGYTSGGAGWKRNGAYKSGATSYDFSKNRLSTQAAFTPGVNPGTGSCANVVCHNMKDGQAAVKWDETLNCYSCHITLE